MSISRFGSIKIKMRFIYLIYAIGYLIIMNPTIPENIKNLLLLLFIAISFINLDSMFILFGVSGFLPFIGNTSPLQIALILLFVRIVAAFSLKRGANISFKKFFILDIILLIWILISSFYNNDYILFVGYAKGLFTSILIYYSLKNKMVSVKISIFNLIFGLLMGSAVTLLSFLNFGGYKNYGFQRLALDRGDPNSLGLSLLFITVFFMIFLIYTLKSHKITYREVLISSLIFVNIFLLLQTASRGSLFSLIITLLIFIVISLVNYKGMFKKRYILKNVIVILFISLVLLMIFTTQSETILEKLNSEFYIIINRLAGSNISTIRNESRFHLLDIAFRYAVENPIFGVGINYFTIHTGLLPHNTYLEYLTGAGLLGLILYLLVWAKVLFYFMKSKSYHNIILVSLVFAFIAISINMATYSAVGDKLFWITYGILSFWIFNNESKVIS